MGIDGVCLKTKDLARGAPVAAADAVHKDDDVNMNSTDAPVLHTIGK